MLLSITSLALSLSFKLVQVFINHCSSGHTGVTAFNHTCLTTLNDILVHLNWSKTHQFVEAHDGFLNIERLSQIVVGCQRDILIGHILLRQHAISHQYKLGLTATVVHFELRAEFATRHWFHVLLTNDKVSIQRINIGQGFLDSFVGVEVVYVAQMCVHEIQELTVVVNQYNGKLLGL